MAPDPQIITDPDLLSVLAAAQATRQHTLALVALLDSNAAGLCTAQKQLHADLSTLRHRFRAVVSSVRATKAATATSRADVDALHLRLQNLFYERAHVAGEIASCESYRHSYSALPLMALEAFLALKPELAGTVAAAAAEEEDGEEGEAGRALMTARIEHEHEVRSELEERRQGLLKRKQGLIAENNKRKEDLANLDKDLEKFIDAAKPIVQTFEKKY